VTFRDWSPAQLAFALGYRIDLVSFGMGQRRAELIGPTGRRHEVSHERACSTLSRLAAWRRVDPASPPQETPRALSNGQEQAAQP
jgi:hypothetical protein